MERRNLLAVIAGSVVAIFVPRPPRAEVAPDKQLLDLQEMIDVQCSNGNWNYDPYMHGMANGMILAQSLLTGQEPGFLDAPDEWLCDRPKILELGEHENLTG